MGASSSIFVNREKELKQVEESVETFQDEQRLLRRPILEFSGLQGIGKSTLLRQIELLCDERGVSCIARNAEQVTAHDFNQLKSLVKAGPAAIILDSLDTASSEQLQSIEARLSDLIENTRLFVVLASRDIKRFERTRSIARKLTIISLEPLKRESCFSYFDRLAQTIPPNIRDIIYDWTGGYPLAMEIMARTILDERLDPTKDQDSKQLVHILMKEVIKEKLLASAPPEEQTRLQTLLALLSVPRRFNLILTQDLIEEFTPQYKLATSLAYITLPKDINEVTSVLSWNSGRAGYCIDKPVRRLFLLQYKVEWAHDFIRIHAFLAVKNKQFAQKVRGLDHIQYICEFFYHLAWSEKETKVRESLAQEIERLAEVQAQGEHVLLQSVEGLVQFYEEFRMDQELKEALGKSNTSFAFSLMYKNFLEKYRQIPEDGRGSWHIHFFSLVSQQPQSKNFDLILEEGMRQIIKQVSRDDAIKLYQDLSRGEELKVLLGEKFDEVSKRILDELLDEEEAQNVDTEQEVYWAPKRD